jgi:hypothetical protein
MGHWAVVVPAEQYAHERLYAGETVEVGVADPLPGDEIVLVAAVQPPVIFGLGRVLAAGCVKYTYRMLDEPLAANGLDRGGALDETDFAALIDRIGTRHRVDADKRAWLVSLDLPIEASSPAEAVRAFWSYVRELGPSELPAFVSPAGNESAMQAFVLGTESNQDPEEG